MTTMKNIVLVHGGFADGAGWEGVYKILKKQGYNVSIVQNPTISLADEVKVTKRILAAQDGPAILVGHSYGGAVITEAGNDPKVAGLVYITAFAPDKGESVATLIKDPPAGAPVPPIQPPQTDFCSWTRRHSLRPLRLTWTRKKPRSWPIPRSPGE
jgi:pimeloyl-ACP methyl ester carboxylesterase